MSNIKDYIEFGNKSLEKRCSKGKIPMETFYEAYFAGDIDVKGDVFDFLRNRNHFINYNLTPGHLKWAVTNFIPEVAIHSRKQDKRIVRNHYDRGNDFFGWFLGERMIYTAAFFENANQTLEEAQDNKLNMICNKLQLAPGEKFLDIGCGWGTLARYAAKNFKTDSTGVTLSENQTEYGTKRMVEDGVSSHSRILCRDYREIPKQKFNKIASIEMVEHVGVKNLQAFYDQVYDLLEDDGIFLLQWTGLRRAMNPEDLIWGLFMNRHVFPGADASLCSHAMLKSMEKANFEVHTVENVTNHYSLTLKRWHENWVKNRKDVTKAYGDRWYRIWNFFLAWSTIVGEQGNAACFQVVLNKNIDSFDRMRYIGHKFTLGERAALGLHAPGNATINPAGGPMLTKTPASLKKTKESVTPAANPQTTGNQPSQSH